MIFFLYEGQKLTELSIYIVNVFLKTAVSDDHKTQDSAYLWDW